MTQYQLQIHNSASFNGQFCVYQKDPDIEQMGAMNLAWFAKGAHTGTAVTFKWDINYNFVWSETGNLTRGVIFKASQTLDCDLKLNNKVTFKHDDNGYYFTDQTTDAAHEGNLIIVEDSSIPANEASVGIGMSGFGTFAWNGEPNVTQTMSPHPEYWVTYGNYKPGEVLDMQQLSFPLQLNYPIGKYIATVEFKADNSWGPVQYV